MTNRKTEAIRDATINLLLKRPILKIDLLSERIFKTLNNCVNAITVNAPVLAFPIPLGK